MSRFTDAWERLADHLSVEREEVDAIARGTSCETAELLAALFIADDRDDLAAHVIESHGMDDDDPDTDRHADVWEASYRGRGTTFTQDTHDTATAHVERIRQETR